MRLASRRLSGACALCVVAPVAGSCAANDDEVGSDRAQLTTTSEVSFLPARDVAREGISADGDSANLYRNVDDGARFELADDESTTVRNSWSASAAAYTAGYSGASGPLHAVRVSFRARASSGVSGTARIELYDGDALIAVGASFALGASWSNYSQDFESAVVSSASALRTKLVLTRSGASGYLRVTQLFVSASTSSAPLDASAAGTTADSGRVADGGSDAVAIEASTSSRALVVDANAVFGVPTVPKPKYLAPVRLAPFGTDVVRISGDAGSGVLGGTWSLDARHHYSKDQPWSSDGSLIVLQNAGTGGQIYLDGNTYLPRAARCAGYSLGDDRWHPSPTHGRERINVKGATLSWFDVVACATTRSWSLPFSVSAFGSGEGNPSSDGRFVALADSTRLFVVDMDPQPPAAPYPNRRIGPPRTINDCGLSSCAVDWVSVSASGKYVVVSYEGDHLRVFDVDPGTLALSPHAMSAGALNPTCAGTPGSGYIYDLGHADLARDPFDGDEDVIVGQEHCHRVGEVVAGQVMGHVVKVRLRDGRVTSLTSPTNEAYAHHVSTRSLDRPGWAFVGYYPSAGKRFDDEIIAVKLDGSGAVERLAHKHSLYSGCYRCESHAVPSRDGRRVLFASNWSAACGSGCGSTSNVQAYVVDAR